MSKTGFHTLLTIEQARIALGVTTRRQTFLALCPTGHDGKTQSLSVAPCERHGGGHAVFNCFGNCDVDALKAWTRSQRNGTTQPTSSQSTTPTSVLRDPLGWIADYTGTSREHIDSLPIRADGRDICFTFPSGIEKRRTVGTKDFKWTEGHSPSVWPLLDEYPASIVLTEGETDAIVLRYHGVEAVGVTKGAKAVLTPSEIKALAQRGVGRIIVAFDADEAGRRGSDEQAAQIASSGLAVATMCPPDYDALSGRGKDWRDWHLRGGTSLPEAIDHTPPPFFISQHSALAIADEDVQWVVPDLIAEGDKVLIAGPQKSLKTFLALDLTRAMTTGSQFLRRPEWTVPRPLRVAFIEEEGSPSLFFRRVAKMGEVDADKVLWAHRRGFRFTDDAMVGRLIDHLVAYEPAAAIFDPLQRMMPGVDENDASKTGIVWDAIQRIQLALPRLAVVVIHHANKQSRLTWESIRGSSRHAGEADLGIFVEKQGEDSLRVVLDGRDIPTVTGHGDALLVTYSITTDGFAMTDTGTRISVSKVAGRTGRTSDESKDLVLEAIRTRPNSTRKEIALALDIDPYTVGEYVRDLERDGQITAYQTSVSKPKTYVVKEEK